MVYLRMVITPTFNLNMRTLSIFLRLHYGS